MGCGPSRPSKPSGPKRPTDCSGSSYCNLYVSDLNNPLFRGTIEPNNPLIRGTIEPMLMDYTTFYTWYNKFIKDINLNNTLVKDYYSRSMTFLNENVPYISEEKIALLHTLNKSSFLGTGVFMTMVMVVMKESEMKDEITPNSLNSWATWYNRYVKVLVDALIQYDSKNDIIRMLEQWMAANPQPVNDGFTDLNKDFKNFSNHNTFLSFINEVKSDNKKISGFTNYTTLKNGFTNQYHSF